MSKKEYLIISSLILLILLTILFNLGDTSHNEVSGYIPSSQTQLAQVASSFNPDTDAALVAHYTFDGNAGDSTGAHNGTTVGNPTYVAGKIGQAVQFDGGSGTYIDGGVLFSSAPTSLTYSAWINWPALPGNTGILGKTHYGQTGFQIYQGGGSVGKQVYCFLDGASVHSQALTTDRWYLISCTWDGSTLSLYVDGQIVGSTAATSFTNPSENFRVGYIPGSSALNGTVDDIRIYNRVLGANEISSIYNLNAPITAPDTQGGGPVVNGVCATTKNTCTSGTFSDKTDSFSQYLWSCVGSNGGASNDCSLQIPEASTADTSTPPMTPRSHPAGVNNEIIPSSRKVDWSRAGVAGGIPSRTTICAHLNTTNTAADINKALLECTNGVVYLDAGTYVLPGITFGGHSNVTLRGAGPGKTILSFTGSDGCYGIYADICVRGQSYNPSNLQYYPNQIHNWVGGYAKGNNRLTLDSVANISLGDMIVLDQVDDDVSTSIPDGLVVSADVGRISIEGGSPGRLGPNGKRSQQQYVIVTDINQSTNQITISPGLYMPNWDSSHSPQIWSLGIPASMNGVEDLTVDNSLNPGGKTNIGFFNAYNSWVKNVTSLNATRNHVWMTQAAHIEVRDSYFYGTKKSESQSYGVETFGSSDDLVINNIFQHVTTPSMGGPDVGSVIAYNFMTDMQYINFNGQNNFLQPGISASHDTGTGMNLFEGNVTNGFSMDLFHGSGALATVYRNQFIGYEEYTDTNTGVTKPKGFTNPIQISGYNRLVNFVGNVIGKQGYHNVYENSLTPSGNQTYSIKSIYYLGYAACCGQSTANGVTYDPKVVSSLLRWGNFDYATNITHWDPEEIPADIIVPTTRYLPPSLFLSALPTFWYTRWGTPSWPAIGPDVNGLVSDIPAKRCYDNTPHDSKNILSFDARECYTSYSGTTPPPPTTPTADFNHDGKINSLDFSLLQGSWNQSSTTYDLNHDGTVNTLDYSLLIQQWTG